ncbi:MAG: hypothetical protein K6E13_04710 [Lachnospiraceae bacterium]|nr:hypothetical protein [Lachnospiraceae bacterium]
MAQGVYKASYKSGIAYRASVTYKNKHISLGSYSSETEAYASYREALNIISNDSITIDNFSLSDFTLKFEKIITLLNFRDKGMYISNPIYMRQNYFSYFLDKNTELKFDIDDLFYYSGHKIIKRGGHLFVNDYGSQINILSRFGIHGFSVAGRDYEFANGDSTDFRYSNIIVINSYIGVFRKERKAKYVYQTKIHINGDFVIGTYSSEIKAAIAYNKAVDIAKSHGLNKNFRENYITEIDGKTYADIYTTIKISANYISYLNNCAD